MIKHLTLIFIIIIMGKPPLSALPTYSSSNIEAVIFDCDGVLVDTEYLKFLAWQEALKSFDVEFSLEEYIPFVGHSSKNILSMIVKEKGFDIPKQVIDVKNKLYHSLQKKGVPPIQEMIDFARKIGEKKGALGIKLGLASSASQNEIRQNLRQIDLESIFDLIISGSDDLGNYEDAEGKNKPKPYIYIEAAKRLGVDPAKCLVFEDTTAGIEAAAGAGMIPIAVPNQFTANHDFAKAKEVVQSHRDLPLKHFFE
jgi:beta-phosphoglucomutase